MKTASSAMAFPGRGWWGFAALNTSAGKMEYKGEAKEVELGAVMWVNFARTQNQVILRKYDCGRPGRKLPLPVRPLRQRPCKVKPGKGPSKD